MCIYIRRRTNLKGFTFRELWRGHPLEIFPLLVTKLLYLYSFTYNFSIYIHLHNTKYMVNNNPYGNNIKNEIIINK